MSRFFLDANDEFGTTIALIEPDVGVEMDLSDLSINSRVYKLQGL